ncbi:hypothetical protein GQ44DRAFT_698076 [Phaeosphaeriaceae sp. PMI808]|nr:hypothetical protein GQ44DRAFT_698076 [Phaeosphaeriaceae sp. PMI808]
MMKRLSVYLSKLPFFAKAPADSHPVSKQGHQSRENARETTMSAPSSLGQESTSRVTGADWRVQPIEHPLTATWNLGITDADIHKLVHGYQPEQMEDRWMCCSDGPDQQGTIVVHIYRSWSGDEQLQLTAKAPTSTSDEGEGIKGRGAEITEIKWERGNSPNELNEGQAKDLATTLCRQILGCKLDAAT